MIKNTSPASSFNPLADAAQFFVDTAVNAFQAMLTHSRRQASASDVAQFFLIHYTDQDIIQLVPLIEQCAEERRQQYPYDWTAEQEQGLESLKTLYEGEYQPRAFLSEVKKSFLAKMSIPTMM